MQNLLSRVLFLFAATAMLSLTACKKDGASTQEKISGKWTVSTIDYHDVSADGQSSTASEVPAAGTYFQFNTDGTFLAHSDDDQAGTWNVKDNKVFINSEDLEDSTGFDIKKLTGNLMDLYSKEGTATEYTEVTIHFKK